jgi:hypothetical protein
LTAKESGFNQMVKKVDEKQRAAIMRQNAINYGNQ